MNPQPVVFNDVKYEKNVLGEWHQAATGELVGGKLAETLEECLRAKRLLRGQKP